MTTKYEIKIYNCETGEEIVRAMTDDEIAAKKLGEAQVEKAQNDAKLEAELKAEAKAAAQAKLAALGLTIEDLTALGL